jgi:hypothetical protein
LCGLDRPGSISAASDFARHAFRLRLGGRHLIFQLPNADYHGQGERGALMSDAKYFLDEKGLHQLERKIMGHRSYFRISLAATLTFLIGFAFVPYKLGYSNKWLFMLIHLLLPIATITLTIPIFRLSKRFLTEGILIQCMHPELKETSIGPLGIFDLIYICWFMVLCVGVPTILVLVILRVDQILVYLWGFLACWTFLTTMEFEIVRTLIDLRS